MASRNGAFLGRPLTARYKPSVYGWNWHLWQSGQRGFQLQDVEPMRRDPQVQFCLRVIASPLHRQRWEVECQNAEVTAYVDSQLKRFWTHDLINVLKMLAWGWVAGEPLWRLHNDLIQFDTLRDFHPLDCTPTEMMGKLTGIKVRHAGALQSDYPILRYPRKFWCTLDPEYGAYHGRPRIAGAWSPWMEKTGRHGALDIRRLWYLKHAYRGGTIRHPHGNIELGNGVTMACQDYARELLEKFETGGIMVLPNSTDDEGNYLWVWEEPKPHGPQQDVRDYPKDLDTEITKGCNIPPEVVQASETGSGWSGRSIPFLVFLTSADHISSVVVDAFDRYVGRPGVMVNYGAVDYHIKLISLTELADVATQTEEAPQLGGPAGQRPPTGQMGQQRGMQRPMQLSIADEIRRRVWERQAPIKLSAETTGLTSDKILELEDIRQPNNYFCGAAATNTVARYHGLTHEPVKATAAELGTTIEKSTHPDAIIAYFHKRGCQVEARDNLTVDDLIDYVAKGWPVICPVQDYGNRRENGASFAYGHYLSVIGIVSKTPRYVICQDSSLENWEKVGGTTRTPGGDTPSKEVQEDQIGAPGRVMVYENDWMKVWHDQDADGKKFVRYGMAVGAPAT